MHNDVSIPYLVHLYRVSWHITLYLTPAQSPGLQYSSGCAVCSLAVGIAVIIGLATASQREI